MYVFICVIHIYMCILYLYMYTCMNSVNTFFCEEGDVRRFSHCGSLLVDAFFCAHLGCSCRPLLRYMYISRMYMSSPVQSGRVVIRCHQGPHPSGGLSTWRPHLGGAALGEDVVVGDEVGGGEEGGPDVLPAQQRQRLPRPVLRDQQPLQQGERLEIEGRMEARAPEVLL